MILMKQIRFNQSKDTYMRNYYTSGRYIDYITRPEATLNKPAFIDLNSVELIGPAKKDEVKQKYKNLDDKQIVWDYAVSLEQDFCEKNAIHTAIDFVKAIKPSLEKFFETNHMHMEDLEIVGALHSNTDNPHMHIGFFEKDKSKELEMFNWKRIGMLGGKNSLNFKQFGINVEKYVVDDKMFASLRENRDYVYSHMTKVEKTDKYANLVSYFASQNQKQRFVYDKLEPKVQNQVMDLVNEVIENNPELKEKYEAYQQTLTNLYETKLQRNQDYGLDSKYQDNLDRWYQLQEEEIDVRNANAILKLVKQDVLDLNQEDQDNFEGVGQVILDGVKDSLDKDVKSQYQKTKHVSNGFKPAKGKALANLNLKPHLNPNAYINDQNEVLDMKHLMFQLNKALDKNINLAMKMYQRMQFEKELANQKAR